jgi:uncharacterized protein YbjT (DUF2867 family)
VSNGRLIVVFGGSGFIGRQIVRVLCRQGYRVRVPMRRPHLGHELRVMGDVGQVQLVQANIRNEGSIAAALEGAHGVVYSVGLLYQKGRQSFAAAHIEGPRVAARAAKAAGVERFVLISAIGARADSKAAYARTKAYGEQAVRREFPAAVILRPSIVFGPEDDFFNRFADMAKFAPALPLIGFGKTRLQPVYVGDVADAALAALMRSDAPGRVFELGGPNVYTFKQLLQFTLATIERKRFLAPLPFVVAQTLGAVLEMLSVLNPFAGPPLTGGQVELLKSDNVVGISGERGVGLIGDLGVGELESIEAIAPRYLWRFRPAGQFHPQRPAA